MKPSKYRSINDAWAHLCEANPGREFGPFTKALFFTGALAGARIYRHRLVDLDDGDPIGTMIDEVAKLTAEIGITERPPPKHEPWSKRAIRWYKGIMWPRPKALINSYLWRENPTKPPEDKLL